MADLIIPHVWHTYMAWTSLYMYQHGTIYVCVWLPGAAVCTKEKKRKAAITFSSSGMYHHVAGRPVYNPVCWRITTCGSGDIMPVAFVMLMNAGVAMYALAVKATTSCSVINGSHNVLY